jgi:hypothetical protein
VPDFFARLDDGWDRASDVLELAFVPFVVAFLNVDAIQRVFARESDVSLGVTLRPPSAVVDVWTFVQLPQQTLSTGTGGTNVTLGGLFAFPSIPFSVAAAGLVLVLCLEALLTAGFLGSLRQQLTTGSYDFGVAVGRYTVPLLVYRLAVTALGFGLVGGVFLLGPNGPGVVLVLIAIPVGLLLGYLFYPIPYLVVLRERGLADAVAGSFDLATGAEGYFGYTLGFAAFSAVVSLVGTAVVVNLGLAGILVGAVAAAPLGLALSATTLRFLADIDDASPTVEWPADDGGDAGDEAAAPTGGPATTTDSGS